MSHGGYAESGLFVLKAPTQYQFRVRGGSKIATGSSVSSILKNITSGSVIDVCGADIGTDVGTRFVIEGATTLLLPPGAYTWQSRLKGAAGSAVGDSSLIGEWAQTPAHDLTTRGARGAFSTLSGNAGSEVNARAYVTCPLAIGERIDAWLIVTDLNTGQALPPAELHYDQPVQDKEIGSVPYVLAAGHLYQARLRIAYTGQAPVSCRLVQSV